MTKIAEYIAFLLFLIAASSETGFKFVHTLVQIVRWFDMGILDPGYIKLWAPFILIGAVALIPAFGIWYELHKTRKNSEKQPMMYPDDDLYDKAVK
jgi:hypothetical protein